jgi:hypothetical protein
MCTYGRRQSVPITDEVFGIIYFWGFVHYLLFKTIKYCVSGSGPHPHIKE